MSSLSSDEDGTHINLIVYEECRYDFRFDLDDKALAEVHIERYHAGQNELQFAFGGSCVFQRKVVRLDLYSEKHDALLKRSYFDLFNGFDMLISRLRGVIDRAGAQMLIERGSTDPVQLLRVLSNATEVADQLERDCIQMKQDVDLISPSQEFPVLVRRVDQLKEVVSTDLVKKADSLFQRASNIMSIDEAHKSRKQAASMNRISWITFIFLPLIFVSGLFGMNIDILDDPGANWYMYLIIGMPTLFLVLAVVPIHKYCIRPILRRKPSLRPRPRGFPHLIRPLPWRKMFLLRQQSGAHARDEEKSEKTAHVYETLKKACSDRSVYTVMRLLKHDPALLTELSRLLLEAAALNDTSVVEFLLEAGADKESRTSEGRTPLMCAAIENSLDSVRILLQAGANLQSTDSYGLRAVDLAALFGHDDIVTVLNAGAVGGRLRKEPARDGNILLYKNVPPSNLPSQAPKGREQEFLLPEIEEILQKRPTRMDDVRDRKGRTALTAAAIQGRSTIVQLLLEKASMDPNVRDYRGQTPLSLAATLGIEPVVNLLLMHPSTDPHSRDDKGRTPLSLAAFEGHLKVVRMLLDVKSVNPNLKDNEGRTALFLASLAGQTTVVNELLQHETVNLSSESVGYKLSPLSIAASLGYEDIVRIIARKCPKEVEWRNPDGWTPLFFAAYGGRKNIAKFLIEDCLASVRARDEKGWMPIFVAAEKGHAETVVYLFEKMLETDNSPSNFKLEDVLGETPLSVAVSNGREDVVKFLLLTGSVDATLQDGMKRTPLIAAAVGGHEGIVSQLLQHVTFDFDAKDNKGETALFKASANGHDRIVELLLQQDFVDINSQNNRGLSVLAAAAEKGHDKVVAWLLTKPSININAQDSRGQTALALAAGRGHYSIVKRLLACDSIMINARDHRAETPLYKAAAEGKDSIVQLLLEQDLVDVNATDENNLTPLAIAAMNGHEAVVKLLVDLPSVKLEVRDTRGGTALSWAVRNRHRGIVQLLNAARQQTIRQSISTWKT